MAASGIIVIPFNNRHKTIWDTKNILLPRRTVFGSKNGTISSNRFFFGKTIVSNSSQRQSNSTKYFVGAIPVFTPLSSSELDLRSQLENQVRSAFYTAGMALTQLNELRLYRSTHLSFEEFCQDVFGFSRDYAYLKMAAAKVYQNLLDNLPTSGRQVLLPTRQRQLRPIIKAKLEDDVQVQVWQEAVDLAHNHVPTSSIVAQVVRLHQAAEKNLINPFTTGEICRLVVRDNSQLKGKGGCWCIIDQVYLSSCTVNTWSDEFEVPIENLESLGFDAQQYQALENIGVRMTKLYETGSLDQAAFWILNGLAKLNRPYLTTLEEKLLELLEKEYSINP